MSPCYNPGPEIDQLATECYEGAKANGFYGPDVLVPEDILCHLKQEIQEVEEAGNLLDATPEVVDCIMVLLGLHERLLQMRFLIDAEIPEEELSLGKQIRDKLKHNKTRGYLHGRKETR